MKKPRLWIAADVLGRILKIGWVHQIIGIERGEKVALRIFHASIARLCPAAVLERFDESDLSRASKRFKHLLRIIGRTIIHDDNFVTLVGLGKNRIESFEN